jgi:hypothetical protein
MTPSDIRTLARVLGASNGLIHHCTPPVIE